MSCDDLLDQLQTPFVQNLVKKADTNIVESNCSFWMVSSCYCCWNRNDCCFSINGNILFNLKINHIPTTENDANQYAPTIATGDWKEKLIKPSFKKNAPYWKTRRLKCFHNASVITVQSCLFSKSKIPYLRNGASWIWSKKIRKLSGWKIKVNAKPYNAPQRCTSWAILSFPYLDW